MLTEYTSTVQEDVKIASAAMLSVWVDVQRSAAAPQHQLLGERLR